jgi:5'-3' exonuclease
LLNRYKNLDEIYKAIDEDKFVVDEETAVWETTLKDNRDKAYLCLKLATLYTKVPRVSL